MPDPVGPVVMRQRWKDLLFLHWKLPVDEIQRTLPPGLMVDVFDGAAWVGVVPFFMEGVRPAGLPALPWLSTFLELNVRTYVRDAAGRPGVWFYSLDCNRWPAVELARRGFHLAYQHATMSASKAPDGNISYQCQRRPVAGHLEADYRYRGRGATFLAAGGSLEFFLTERYRLFSWHPRRRLLRSVVYQIAGEPALGVGLLGDDFFTSAHRYGLSVCVFPNPCRRRVVSIPPLPLHIYPARINIQRTRAVGLNVLCDRSGKRFAR